MLLPVSLFYFPLTRSSHLHVPQLFSSKALQNYKAFLKTDISKKDFSLALNRGALKQVKFLSAPCLTTIPLRLISTVVSFFYVPFPLSYFKIFIKCSVIFSLYRPRGSHCLLLPMVSSLYCLNVCIVIVTFICIKK